MTALARTAGVLAGLPKRKLSRARPVGATMALLLLCLGLLAAPAQAAPGDLDPTFGTGGKVVSDFRPGADDEAIDTAIQPDDGKILVLVRTRGLLADNAGGTLVRYMPDGRSLDASFGTGGRVPISLSTVAGLALQGDRKIVTVGSADTVGGSP
jgi:hypothetical protein